VTRIVSQRTLLAPAPARGIAAAVVTVLAAAAVTVAALRLVETAVLALPHDSIPVVGQHFRSLVPETWIVPRVESMSARASRMPRDAAPAAVRQPERQLAEFASPSPAPVVEPPSATDVGAPDPEPLPHQPDAPVVTEAVATPVSPPPAAGSPDQSPWKDVADGGLVLGRKSKDAGVATAGAFTRFARRVAGAVR
jgi:hypothetical protein